MRNCYQCKKEIKDVPGKYYCSQECWDVFGKNFKKIINKPTIKEIQSKLLEIGKSKKFNTYELAKEIFE